MFDYSFPKAKTRPVLGAHARDPRPGDEECISEAKGLILGSSKKYKLVKRISGGSFGHVYIAEDEYSERYIVKQESKHIRRPHLINEYNCVKYLQKGCHGIPRVMCFEKIRGYHYIVMDLKGPNLTELFGVCKKNFTSRSLAHLVLQILPVFQYIHMHGILHRDLKPENIVVGRWPDNCRKVYLIDFGLAKQFIFRDEFGSKRHIPKKNPERRAKSSLTGTVRYASINAHYGDQGRKDDLESFGYVLVYLLKGGWLPWMGIQANTKAAKYARILKLKESCNMKFLLQKHHREFRIYMDAARKMQYNEKPDYEFFIRLFNGLFKRKGWDADAPLDWESEHILKQQWPKY